MASKFTGIGTVLRTGIPNLAANMAEQPPEIILKDIRAHLDAVCILIERHSGTIVQFSGDSVLAFWHPNTKPSHAQSAFHASKALLEYVSASSRNQESVLRIAIALGTGVLGGEFFGPTKQFQIVGAAVSIAKRLSEVKPLPESFIRMSQYTASIIDAPGLIQEKELIERTGSDSLKLYTYRRPA